MELHYPLILDGATGTQLQARGYTGGVCAEQWILEHPETIIEIQQNYVAAGSNIVYAPTFGANRVKLEENGLIDKVWEYNHKLVALSKEAVGSQALVAGDIAPTGLFIAPMGNATFEELYDIYKEQVEALEDAGVDLYVIETTMTVPEARAAMLAVRTVSEKPVIVTFTCEESGKTLTGTDITAALMIMQRMGASAFGLNCSVGPEQMLEQLKRLKAIADIPLIAKPNAGMPKIVNGKTVYECATSVFYEYATAFAQTGVCIFGGCCGTTVDHIKALSAADKPIVLPKRGSHNDRLMGATEKQMYALDVNVSIGAVLSADEGLEEAMAEHEGQVLAIRIDSETALQYFEKLQYAVSKPLCLVCDDAILLEKALRAYQGIALYEGSLSDDVLLPLSNKYGLIL